MATHSTEGYMRGTLAAISRIMSDPSNSASDCYELIMRQLAGGEFAVKEFAPANTYRVVKVSDSGHRSVMGESLSLTQATELANEIEAEATGAWDVRVEEE